MYTVELGAKPYLICPIFTFWTLFGFPFVPPLCNHVQVHEIEKTYWLSGLIDTAKYWLGDVFGAAEVSWAVSAAIWYVEYSTICEHILGCDSVAKRMMFDEKKQSSKIFWDCSLRGKGRVPDSFWPTVSAGSLLRHILATRSDFVVAVTQWSSDFVVSLSLLQQESMQSHQRPSQSSDSPVNRRQWSLAPWLRHPDTFVKCQLTAILYHVEFGNIF